ncbi:MAG: long-chain fatty acid--CoA ligase [Nocardioidaceae bacterium]|nr:long-chain fatty acid--CoA ligase [Nocardioidaceae bacterium]
MSVLADRADIDAALAPSIAAAFAATVDEQGDNPALSDRIGVAEGWRTLSWRELREQGLALAAALVDLGVQPGDRVAIMASNRIEHVLADVAAMHAGATAMSIYNTLSPAQVAYIAEHAKPSVVVLENDDHLARWSLALAGVPHVVVIDAVAPEGALTWAELVDRAGAVRDKHAAEAEKRWQALGHDDPATILYTSGTTGDPKGVVITHRNVLFEAESSSRTSQLTGENIGVSYLPYAHIAERVLGIYIPMVEGAHLYLVGDPAQLVGTLAEVRPTRFFGVPRVWEKIQTGIGGLLAMETDEAKKKAVAEAMATGLEYIESLQYGEQTSPELQARFDAVNAAVLTPMKAMLGLDRVTWAGSASAPMPLETARFFAGLGLPIYDIYGMTETCGSVTACGPGSFRLGTVGRAQPGIEIGLGEDGEILARGPVTTSGYYRNAEATGALVDAEGWVHTGDIGELDADGFLKVVDRKKEMIITSAGKNIAPSNIENLLKESPLVGHALAFGEGRPYVVAILTLDPDVAPVIAGKLGLSSADLASLAQEPAILGMVEQAVAAANERLSRPEQVKKWTLLPVEWTAESAELTPTLKLKRRVVHANYAEEIAALYA